MPLKMDVNDAISVLIEMTAESIATTRLLVDAVAELTYPDDKVRQLAAQMLYRQKSEQARIAILHKIYEHRGKIDLDDIGLGQNEPPKE